MKKLLVVATIIATAVCANAASVSWSATGITAPGTTTKTANYIAYLFQSDVTSYATVQAALAGGTFDTVTGTALASALSNTGGAVTKGGIGSYGASASAADPENVSFYMVLFDAATVSDASNYILSSEKTVTFTSATGTKSAAFVNVVSSSTSGWTATSVPEPTSGLLMLLGMAGLALRRRRA